MPVTIHELAVYRGLKTEEDGSYTMADIEEVGLPLLSGCENCGASLAAYNAYPSTTGFIRCAGCIGSLGWTTVEEAAIGLFNIGEEDGNLSH
jgi:hypothetical protein